MMVLCVLAWQAASEGGHGAEQNAANWQHASTFYRQFDGAIEAPAALRVPAVLSTLSAVPLPGICGASWIPYDAGPPEGLGLSLHAAVQPGREPMSDGGAPAGDSDAFTFPRLPAEERQQLRAACRREADSYCTAWNQSLRPAQVSSCHCGDGPGRHHISRAGLPCCMHGHCRGTTMPVDGTSLEACPSVATW